MKDTSGIAQWSMQPGRIKACLAESLLSPGALTADRQYARIATLNAAVSLSAFSATTIIRRTDVQGSPWRAIRGPKTERKQRSLNEASRKPNSKHYAALDIARGYVALGDKNEAFAWLDRAYSAHERDLIFLRRMDDFDPIRSDPRFEGLLRRIGMPQ